MKGLQCLQPMCLLFYFILHPKVEILRLNNTFATLEAKRDQVQTERMYWENQATLAENAACKRTLLLGRIKMATANLYTLVRASQKNRGSTERISRTDIQLDKIKVKHLQFSC